MPTRTLGGAHRNVIFTIYTERKDRFFRGAGGEIDTRTKEVAERVLSASKDFIGKTYSGDHGNPRLRDTGRVVRASTPGDWKVTFRHRAAEVHYKGTRAYRMPRKSKGEGVYARKKRNFGPTKGPINRRALRGNPYIEKAARKLGLIVSDRPTIEAEGTTPGVIRIPRGFA